MIEQIAWADSIIPGFKIILFAAGIIIAIVFFLLGYFIARKINHRQWPAEAQKERLNDKHKINILEEDLKNVITAYNERYAVDKQIKSMLDAIDNRILKRRNK